MMVPTKDYQNLVDKYKGRITESTLLNKAAKTAAERELILKDPRISASTALALTKPKAREVRKLTRRIRMGNASSAPPPQEDDDAMLNSPIENSLKKLLKLAEKNDKARQGGGGPRRKLPTTPTPALKRPSLIPRPIIKPHPPTTPKPPNGFSRSHGSRSKPNPSGARPKTEPRGGFGKALKSGFKSGLAKHFKVGRQQSSDSDEDDGQKKKTPRAVRRIRPDPGWDDWYEGKKTRRHLLQELKESEKSSTKKQTRRRKRP